MKKHINSIKSAFTLAEVLITLGVIGVVAAITIPGIIASNKAHKLRSQYLKTYSTLQQAFKLMENDDISLNPSDYGRRVFCDDMLSRYLTGVTVCGNSNSSPCYNIQNGKPYKSLSGVNVNSISFDDGQLLLKDGTLLMCEYYPGNDGWEIWISADINGYTNPPNIWGYDLFTFQFTEGELKPMGDIGTEYELQKDSLCSHGETLYLAKNGITCAWKARGDNTYFKQIVSKFK